MNEFERELLNVMRHMLRTQQEKQSNIIAAVAERILSIEKTAHERMDKLLARVKDLELNKYRDNPVAYDVTSHHEKEV